MIYQIGNELPFSAFFISNKAGKTGLTVTVNVYRNDTLVVSGGAATEIGDGLYRYNLAGASVTEAGHYRTVFKTTDTTVDLKEIPTLEVVGQAWVERVDAAISSRSTLTAAQVWANTTRTLTQSGASVAAAISGSALAVTHGVTYSATITGLTIPATWVKMFFTSKKDIDNDPDTASVIQIVESATPAASDGILYLGGATVSTTVRDYGSLTVNQGAGTVGIGLDDSLDLSNLGGLSSYDLKCLLADGTTVLVSNAASLSIGFTPTRSVA